MIVVGAGAGARELMDILTSEKYNYHKDNLFFFDNTVSASPEKFLGAYRVLTSFEEAKEVTNSVSSEFCLSLTTPKHRYNLTKKFERLGGRLTSVISENVFISKYSTLIEDGTTMLNGVYISCDSHIGKGAMISVNAMIGHDVSIGECCYIMPGVNITGYCQIGNYTTIGTGCILTPGVKIGNNCSIAAGSVVTKNIPDNSLVVGIMPSRVVERLPEFEL